MSIPSVMLNLVPTIAITDLDTPTDSVKEKILQGAHAGFMYVKLTEDWNSAIAAGKLFAKTFPTGPDAFRDTYVVGAIEGLNVPIGYAPMTGFQCESFRLITTDAWSTHLPSDVVKLGERLIALAAKVLTVTLKALNVREELWGKLTGDAATGKEQVTLTFNRYSATREGEGLPTHQDSGLITILYNDQPGLQGRIGNADDWSEITPKENHLIVNFGRSLEACFLNDPARKLIAVPHRVPHLNKDRTSFALFFDRDPNNSLIYQTLGDEYHPLPSQKNPGQPMTFAEFQKATLDKFDTQTK